MSEYFKDFFANFRERISNPLVFSYFIAWIFWNWKVTLALIWHDSSQQVINGVQYSISGYVDSLIGRCGSYSVPFIIAIVYTFVLPFIKGWIQSFNLKVRKFFEEKHFKIDNTRTVSLSKYLHLREKLNEDLDLVHRNILSEEERIQEKQRLEQNNQVLRDENGNLNSIITELNTKLSSTFDVNVLNGYWSFELEGGRLGQTQRLNIFINDSKIYRVNKDDPKIQISRINRYFMHPDRSFMYIEFQEVLVGFPENVIAEIPKVLFISSGDGNWYHSSNELRTQIKFNRVISNY